MKTIAKKNYNEPQMAVVIMKSNMTLMAGSPGVGASVGDRDGDTEDVGYY
ncbi:hypothetical protein SAMN02910409_0005 [Prevotellaceae bacterium HUN156]|nr:hypothetical protein SAMN02910409_0005 [Prevotellaceae bacterium HUN156]